MEEVSKPEDSNHRQTSESVQPESDTRKATGQTPTLESVTMIITSLQGILK